MEHRPKPFSFKLPNEETHDLRTSRPGTGTGNVWDVQSQDKIANPLDDLSDYSPDKISNEKNFSFAVEPPKSTEPVPEPVPDRRPTRLPSALTSKVASAPFPVPPPCRDHVAIATGTGAAAASAAPPTSAVPLVLRFDPADRSIFATSIGSGIDAASHVAASDRRFSLQHIGQDGVEEKRADESNLVTPPLASLATPPSGTYATPSLGTIPTPPLGTLAAPILGVLATPNETIPPRYPSTAQTSPHMPNHSTRTPCYLKYGGGYNTRTLHSKYSHCNRTPYSRTGSTPNIRTTGHQQSSRPTTLTTLREQTHSGRSFIPTASSAKPMDMESVEVHDTLVARILYFYHVHPVQRKFNVTIKEKNIGFEVLGNAVNSAAQELRRLEREVKDSIVQLSWPLGCQYLPLFDRNLVCELTKYEKMFCVQMKVVQHHCNLMNIDNFCTEMEKLFSLKETTPASSLGNYLTTQYSHKWYEVIGKDIDLPDNLNETLNLSYSSQSVVQVSLEGSDYLVDFQNMKILVKDKYTNIKAVPSYWCYHDNDFGTKELDKPLQEAIEAFLLFGNPIEVEGRSYDVDHEGKKLTCSCSDELLLIERVPPLKSSTRFYVPRMVVFLISGLKDDITKFLNKLWALISNRTVKKELPLKGTEAVRNAMFNKAKQYCVNVTEDEENLSIEGSPEYTEKVMSQLQHMYLELLTRNVPVLPSNWEEMKGNFELKSVPSGSDEFKKVLSLMQRTLLSIKILKLERIQNQWLWDKYTFAKQRMTEKNDGVVNEMELFHGTRKTDPEAIYKSEHGFDFRFSEQGMWGTGAYFAVNASYSDNYSYAHASGKKMLLASVITGHSHYCKPDKSLRKPPLKIKDSTFKGECYDSVKGITGGSDIYVVYDHEKAYPSYLITYKT